MKSCTFLSLLFFSLVSPAQMEAQDARISPYGTKDQIIKTLYSVISGDAGQERDWDLFRSLFTADAQMIPIQKNREAKVKAEYLSPQDYIDRSGAWLIENGFFEKEIFRKEDCFANICHLFSTYEAFKSSTDKMPFMRGINSIQLMYDENRWWIVNIAWQAENKNDMLPSHYLPKKD